ncbi:MAG: hypothetical protein MRY51_07220 [Flavobacteriaceae bacterium]|nr:hypothetical protein [Flavobacteriaceae bacterium]MCI5088751.1 hypothetical protein [Flavobacteriaceae bacterium]
MQDILNTSKIFIIDYVNNLSLSENIKKRILDSDFFSRTPSIYFYYPFLFVDKNIEDEKLSLLNVAGFLFYQSSIVLDDMIDDKDYLNLSFLMIIQEESIKILGKLFDLKSNFWIDWNIRRRQFQSSIKMEKLFSHNQNLISLKEFERLSIFKVAFAKANIDALFELNYIESEPKYLKILKSHEYFSISLQINDDILDFIDDYKSGQFNIAVLRSTNIFQDDCLNSVKRDFYLKGLASQLFSEAIQYLEMALIEISGFNLSNWENEIKLLKNKFENSILEISYYNYFHNSKSNCSLVLLKDNCVRSSIKKGIKFLKKKQNINGSWMEFITEAGISDVWATGFITYFLSEEPELKSKFKRYIDHSVKFLVNNKSEKIWGFNKNWIDDLDSTNMVFLSQYFNNKTINQIQFKEWLNYYINGKGFSTYNNSKKLLLSLNDSNIRTAKEWVKSHQCVTAVSFYFLIVSGLDNEKSSELESIFIDLIKSDNVNSYWWTSSIYTYYFLHKSFQLLGNIYVVKLIQQKTKTFLNAKGYYEDLYGENVFYSSLVLEIFLHDFDKYKLEINALKDYLLSQQYTDGSFRNSTTLFIPNPEGYTNTKRIYKSSTLGTSVCSIEFSRLFSSIAAIKSLSNYEKRIGCTKIIE